METSLVVYETPELQKTIEELNDEIEPKMFSHNLGIENKPRELTLPEIFEIFNAEKPKPSVFSYIKEPKVVKSKENRIKMIERELQAISDLLTDDPDPDLYLEFSELEEKLMRIKENSQSESKKHSFPSSNVKSYIQIPDTFGNDVAYEMSLTETEDRNRFSRLENKVRELEFAIGTWKQSKPICEVLAEFLAKAKFLNLELLDRIKEQARHLGTDLDIMLSTDSSPNTADNSKQISDLYRDAYSSISNYPKLSLFMERLNCCPGLYSCYSALAKSLLNLEVSSENILGRASHSLIALENMKEGLEENIQAVNKNLEIIKKKILRK